MADSVDRFARGRVQSAQQSTGEVASWRSRLVAAQIPPFVCYIRVERPGPRGPVGQSKSASSPPLTCLSPWGSCQL
jgi:hypothetical protein